MSATIAFYQQDARRMRRQARELIRQASLLEQQVEVSEGNAIRALVIEGEAKKLLTSARRAANRYRRSQP